MLEEGIVTPARCSSGFSLGFGFSRKGFGFTASGGMNRLSMSSSPDGLDTCGL